MGDNGLKARLIISFKMKCIHSVTWHRTELLFSLLSFHSKTESTFSAIHGCVNRALTICFLSFCLVFLFHSMSSWYVQVHAGHRAVSAMSSQQQVHI